MSRSTRNLSATGAVLLLLAGGCAYYSTQGGMVGGIHTLAVPLAVNDTAEFDLAELLTERAEQAYTRDGRLRVVDEQSADAILRLTVLSREDAPFTYTADETTQQYRFRVIVAARLVRARDSAVLLDLPRLEGWGTYDASADDAQGRHPAVIESMDMVVQELLDRTASNW